MFDIIVIKFQAEFQIQRLDLVQNVVSHKSGIFSWYLDIKILIIIKNISAVLWLENF